MNLVSGVIEEIYVQEGMTMGKVSVRGASLKVPLTFIMHARVGDTSSLNRVWQFRSVGKNTQVISDGGDHVSCDSR